MTNEELVARWREFVGQVESGYEMGLVDYRNELHVRARLAKLGLESRVRDVDERYKKLLIGNDTRIWETAEAEGFWEFGYPSNTKGELLADLQAEGLL